MVMYKTRPIEVEAVRLGPFSFYQSEGEPVPKWAQDLMEVPGVESIKGTSGDHKGLIIPRPDQSALYVRVGDWIVNNHGYISSVGDHVFRLIYEEK